MKQKTNPLIQIKGFGKLTSCIIAFCWSNFTIAQNSVSHFFNTDMKHYSTEQSNVTTDHVVMAGTVYSTSSTFGSHFHFVRLDNLKNLAVSEIYQPVNMANVVDVRCVDIVPADAALGYFLTGYVTRNNGGNYITTMMILRVDDNGGLLDQREIALSPDEIYGNIFPLHTIWLNSNLYICGYETPIGSTWVNADQYPTYNTEKRIFISKYDPGFSTYTSNTWDYRIWTTRFNGNWEYPLSFDYDIPMRMTIINNDIHITGSCNTGWNFIPICCPNRCEWGEFSGTLNLVVDQTLSQVHNKPFKMNLASVSEVAEYGMGIIPDQNGDGYYLVGNYFWWLTSSPFNDYNPSPEQFWITHLDNSFNYDITVPTRAVGPYVGWSLQVLPSLNGNTATIAGLQNRSNCYSNPTPSDDFISPFLTDVTLDFAANYVGYNSWVTYPPSLGTLPAGNPNSYRQLGQFGTCNGWNPTFASIDQGNNKFNLSGGIADPTTTNLNFRHMDPDNNGLYPQCDNGAYPCSFPPSNFSIYIHEPIDLTACDTYYYYNTDYFEVPEALEMMDAEIHQQPMPEHSWNSCSGGVWKPASITETKGSFTTIYPNPAHDHISIQLQDGIADDADIAVEMINIYGQLVKVVYSGDAAKLKAGPNVPLPDVASGMYLIKVYEEDKLLIQSKLMVK